MDAPQEEPASGLPGLHDRHGHHDLNDLPAESVAAYHRTRAALAQPEACWVFAYASLLWRPEFHPCEVRRARLQGWHRALEMRSRINRGTPERPGLVFALVGGGACVGHVQRIAPERIDHDLALLWRREMPLATYVPRWLPCQTAQGPVRALAFTLSRHHPSYTGPLDEAELRHILLHAHGRYGSTLDYLMQTVQQLEVLGIHDRKLERLARLARSLA